MFLLSMYLHAHIIRILEEVIVRYHSLHLIMSEMEDDEELLELYIRLHRIGICFYKMTT